METKITYVHHTTPEEFKKELIEGVNETLENFRNSIEIASSDKLLTREETSELLSISLTTLWSWTKKNILPAYRIGNKVRYKQSEVLSALQKMNTA